MSVALPDAAREILDAPEFATLATIMPDGQPHLSVVWIERDGDDVLVSTVEGRRKHLNMLKDPRVSVLLYPKDNPYTYVEIRGTASMTTEGGVELITKLNKFYTGNDTYDFDEGTDNVRVVVRITPHKVLVH